MSAPTLESTAGAAALPESGSRRTRLREFQAQLVQRMQAAAGTQGQSSRLGIMIGKTRWLLDLREAGEIISVGSLTKVPLTRDWYLGLTNIRGNLVSVIDLARFQGMAATPIEKDSRIVAFAPALVFNGGLLVSRVLGLRSIDDMAPDPVPAPSAPSWMTQRYIDRDAQVWHELKLASIVQDPDFLQVGL